MWTKSASWTSHRIRRWPTRTASDTCTGRSSCWHPCPVVPLTFTAATQRSNLLFSRRRRCPLQVEHILTLVARIFRVQCVLVCLCAHERVYIRNARGFAAGDFPWRWGFCGWGIATPNPEVLVIEDAREDARRAFDKALHDTAADVDSPGARSAGSCCVTSDPAAWPCGSMRDARSSERALQLTRTAGQLGTPSAPGSSRRAPAGHSMHPEVLSTCVQDA